MLEAGANVDAKYLRTGHTPLIRAAWLGDVSIIEELLKYGANIEARTTFGSTALHMAASSGSLEALKVGSLGVTWADSLNSAQ